MANLLHQLARPRSLLALVVIVPILTVVSFVRNGSPGQTAVGYIPPTRVLPTYESSSNIPFCLPQGVDNHASIGGYHDQDEALRKTHEQGLMQDSVPAEGIKAYMRSHIKQKQQGFDAKADEDFLGIKLYGPIDLEEYKAELMETYEKYLAIPYIRTPSFLPLVKSRLSLSPPIAPLAPRPRTITTTDAHRDLVPWQFARWKELLPDWEIRVFEDADMEKWMSDMFGGTVAERVWSELPRMVLKTDILRYFILLVEGGIYSDSDTAPIIHPDQWGYPYTNATDPLLSHLSRILSLSNSAHHIPAEEDVMTENSQDEDDYGDLIEESDLDAAQLLDSATAELGSPAPPVDNNLWRRADGVKGASATAHLEGVEIGPGMSPIVDDGAELGPPSLVVSVESDAIEFGWTNWREVGLSRADQIVQWTIMARPGHPVFLDAIGRSLQKSVEMAEAEKEAAAKGEVFLPESALEWTGPGIFTDSVMRYLLTRYGFQPRELLHVKDPIRIGDVLIVRSKRLTCQTSLMRSLIAPVKQLPAGSYSSVSPFTGEAQRKWAASYHGFFGRWRDADPQIQEQERLKKIKEDEEKEAERLKEEQEAEGRVETEEVSLDDKSNLW